MSLEPVKPRAEAGDDLDQPRQQFDFSGPWFSAKVATAYVCCASVKAFYMWRRRHGIIARSNGSVAKADLDRELKRRRPRRVMHPASLANLHKRHGAAVLTSSVSPKSGQGVSR